MKNDQKETLFSKLGGIKAVKAVVEEFYTRLLADPVTGPMFEGVPMPHLKRHQVEFMKVAFTQIPKDLDVPAFLFDKHLRLFKEKGLNEKHFDLVAQHFVGACQQLQVDRTLIDEAVGILAPLRGVFEDGFLKFNGPVSEDEGHSLETEAVEAA